MEKNEMVAGGWCFGWNIPRITGGAHRARIISIDIFSVGGKTVVAKKGEGGDLQDLIAKPIRNRGPVNEI
ncbi:MAG: hypothetical protein SVK08_09120 [Halobacteriota archaeon]|nr:hypothetical protein [Halobacteriota archaeon]